MMTPAEAARRYLLRGWSPIPVPHRCKAPGFPRWQDLRLIETGIPRHFNGRTQNIGVLLGAASANLVDVDIDAPEALRLADYFLPETGCTFGRPSKPTAHRVYNASPLPMTKQFEDAGTMLV